MAAADWGGAAVPGGRQLPGRARQAEQEDEQQAQEDRLDQSLAAHGEPQILGRDDPGAPQHEGASGR